MDDEIKKSLKFYIKKYVKNEDKVVFKKYNET